MRLVLFILLSLGWQSRAAPVTALAFSPDGTVLVSAAGMAVTLRSPMTGEVITSLPCEKTRITSLVFASKGALLAAGGGIPGEKGEVRLLEWRAKRWLVSHATGSDLVTGVAFSPDGKHLSAACMDKIARVFQIEDNGSRLMEVRTLKGHSGPVSAVAISPDGRTVVTTSLDRSLKVWSAEDGTLIRSLGQHTEAVHCLAISPVAPDHSGAPDTCASGSDDNTVRVWQPVIGRMVRIVRGHGGSVLALAYASDGRSLFSAGQEGIVRQIDADSDAILNEWRTSTDWIHSLAISPDGKTLAAGDWTGKVTLLQLK